MGNNSQYSNILVIKLRNIGDVLLSTPLFSNLREAYPAARITALVNAGTEQMLTENPAIDEVLVYDRRIKKEPLTRRIRKEVAFYAQVRKKGFDLVLNLTEGDRGALLALCSGAGTCIGIDPNGKGLFGKRLIFSHLLPRDVVQPHTVEDNLRFLQPLGIAPRHKRVSFHFSDADAAQVGNLLAECSVSAGGYFHAHVTSRWMFKALPPAKAAFLLDRLASLSGVPALLTCAPDKKELDYLASVRAQMHAPHHDLGGKLTLKQLGALSASARFFAGVDSAPMHMAAALDIPVLGVFGPSSVEHWGPWDNSLTGSPYLEKNGRQSSGKHFVLQASRPCVPCHRDGCNGSKVSDCLDFSEEELEGCAREFLSSVSGREK